jgi:hypothetical protein
MLDFFEILCLFMALSLCLHFKLLVKSHANSRTLTARREMDNMGSGVFGAHAGMTAHTTKLRNQSGNAPKA